MKIFKFPVSEEKNLVSITDRSRNSGLTSVRFVAEEKVVCCDFGAKIMYLAKLKDDGIEILDSCPTVTQDGTPVQTDLLDVRNNLLVVSNYPSGSFSFYNLHNDRLIFSHELNTNDWSNCHGVRFIPGVEDLLWASFCGVGNKCFELVNYKTGTLVRRVWTDEQMQDVAFLGEYALACARTNNHAIRGGRTYWSRLFKGMRMYSTVYLYRMPKDIYTGEPVLIDTWHGEGHLDAFIEFQGRAYATNQYCDRVEVFSIKNDRIHLERCIGGYKMPHGIDIRRDGLMAVTNYGDQTLRLRSCSIKHNKSLWLALKARCYT